MLLLIDILKHRPKGTSEPVPVWLTLGSWNPDTTPLPDWATTTLVRDYPGLVATAYGGPGTAAELIRTGRVALFLDGLDEMPPPPALRLTRGSACPSGWTRRPASCSTAAGSPS